MKLKPMFLTAALICLSTGALAGSHSGNGPAMGAAGGALKDSSGGCVIAVNAGESAGGECGMMKKEPAKMMKKEEPKVVTRVVVDCTKCPK